MAATPIHGAEGVGQLYSFYKKSTPVNINGTTKAMSTALDLAYFVVQSFYDGDTGQGQRADLIQAIATACGLFKGSI